MERTDNDGTWTSPDEGATWLLTAPSQAWLDARDADPDPGPVPTVEERIATAVASPDPQSAAAVRAELSRLATQASAARALATQFRGSTGTQKNAIVADRFDDVLDSLADTYDTIALLIRAAVRD